MTDKTKEVPRYRTEEILNEITSLKGTGSITDRCVSEMLEQLLGDLDKATDQLSGTASREFGRLSNRVAEQKEELEVLGEIVEAALDINAALVRMAENNKRILEKLKG